MNCTETWVHQLISYHGPRFIQIINQTVMFHIIDFASYKLVIILFLAFSHLSPLPFNYSFLSPIQSLLSIGTIHQSLERSCYPREA